MPTGKATDIPAIAMAADNKIFAALKIIPPRKALRNVGTLRLFQIFQETSTLVANTANSKSGDNGKQ